MKKRTRKLLRKIAKDAKNILITFILVVVGLTTLAFLDSYVNHDYLHPNCHCESCHTLDGFVNKHIGCWFE